MERHYYRVYSGSLKHHNSRFGEDSIADFMANGFTTPNPPHRIPHNPNPEEYSDVPNGFLISFDEPQPTNTR